MTSKFKCPVCGKTELIRFFNPLTGEYFEDYDCPFRLCNFRGNKVAVDALIQAKQDLEIARKALKKYADEDMWENCCIWDVEYIQGLFLEHGYKIAKEALEQINRKED